MPYSSEIRVANIDGTSFSVKMLLTLWELSTTVDNQGRVHDRQDAHNIGTVSFTNPVKLPFSTTLDPDFKSALHSIALSASQDGFPGPAFRSGKLDTLPAGSPGNAGALVDVILLDRLSFTMAQINAMIPATPFSLPNGIVITSVSITSAPPSRDLTLVATGANGATTFTYTLNFTIDPSDDQVDLTKVLVANASGRGNIVFTAGVGGGFEAFLGNLFSGLFEGRLTLDILGTITGILNAVAATEGAKQAAAQGFTGGLPAGVVLGVRGVRVVPNGDIMILPAIGSFGSLVDIFLAATPPVPQPATITRPWNWGEIGKPNGVNLRATMGAVTVMNTPTSLQRAHVFVEGDDSNLLLCWADDGGNYSWRNMFRPDGVKLRAMMGAVTVMDTPDSPQRAHVFVEGNDFNLWCRWSDGMDWHWLNMGKPAGVNLRAMMGAVTVMNTPTSPQRPHVFVEGNDFNLWCDWLG